MKIILQILAWVIIFLGMAFILGGGNFVDLGRGTILVLVGGIYLYLTSKT